MCKSEIYFIGKRKQPWPEILKQQNIFVCTSLDFSWTNHNTWFTLFYIKHCVKYAKFTTDKKHIQVLPYKGISSPITVMHLILLCCSF